MGASLRGTLVRGLALPVPIRRLTPPRTRSPRTPIERALVYPTIGALTGAWLGAIPIGLDWERPWQVGLSQPSRPPCAPLTSWQGMASHAHLRRSRWVHRRVPRCPGSQRDARARPGRHRARGPEVREIQEFMIQY